MKRMIAMLASVVMLACLAASCRKEAAKASIEGCWELSEVQTKAVDYFGTPVSVYVSFQAGNFELYQRIGAGHYRKLTGTYAYADGSLSGKYADGNALGSVYAVSLEDGRMLLTSKGGSETDVYTSIPEIPAEVISDSLL